MRVSIEKSWSGSDKTVDESTPARPSGANIFGSDPTSSQRTIWAIGQLLPPAIVAVGVWLVFQIVRSTRRGDPFTPDNERRLWSLPILVGVGGTAYQLVAGFLNMLLIQRSAAADMFATTATISFLPLILGFLIALLAAVWRIGIDLREDVEATISCRPRVPTASSAGSTNSSNSVAGRSPNWPIRSGSPS